MRTSARLTDAGPLSARITEDDLSKARSLAAVGADDAARAAYLALLARDPTHVQCLNELGALALSGGFRSAARTVYEQAVLLRPDDVMARVNLANVLGASNEPELAKVHYLAALACDPDHPQAHQGLATILATDGDTTSAAYHREKGFSGHAIVERPHRGSGPAARVLLLVSAQGGNIPTDGWLNDRRYAITAIYADYFDTTSPMPAHDLVVNAIGDADLCGEALARATELCARSGRPVINPPDRIVPTGRAKTATFVAGIPSVQAPDVRVLTTNEIRAMDAIAFPVLIRLPGYHTGQHFHRAEDRSGLLAILDDFDRRPGCDLLLISCLDARGADGLWRKYRVMFIDGTLYPIHLAVSAHWKVHYFTSAMADAAVYRAEEARFLTDPAGVIGEAGMMALRAIANRLGLDYAGIDFGLNADGEILVFEVNATMVLIPPAADPVWDYRQPAISRAFDAVEHMLRVRLGQ